MFLMSIFPNEKVDYSSLVLIKMNVMKLATKKLHGDCRKLNISTEAVFAIHTPVRQNDS